MATRDEYLAEQERYITRATKQAAITLLWQATDASEDGGNGYPIGEDDHGRLNGQAGEEYIDEVIPLIEESVRSFVTDNYTLLRETRVKPSQCGHDLILTANHHGAGFWDRGLGEAGDRLTEATRGYSFDAEFELFGEERETDDHCADELAWLMVENTVILDLIEARAS